MLAAHRQEGRGTGSPPPWPQAGPALRTGADAGTPSEDLHGVRLLKAADLLDLVHEVPAVHVLHHEIQAVLQRAQKTISAPWAGRWDPFLQPSWVRPSEGLEEVLPLPRSAPQGS